MKRRLAAILYADVAGYSRLTGTAEQRTHERLAASLDLLTSAVEKRGGKKVHEAGDAILAEFASATDAVDTAVAFQREMNERNAGLPAAESLCYRIGVNLGEVIDDRDDIYGDGVNLAARIQELAEPGGVCVSGSVHEQVAAQVDAEFDDLGYRRFKNIRQSVHVYGVRLHARDDLHPILRPAAVHGQPLFDDDFAGSPVTTGRCLCGSVRYEVSEPAIGTGFCHCRICQRALGAPVNAWTAFPVRALRFVTGELRQYRSSLIAERGFCANCGSSLTARLLAPEPSKYVAICTMSLDNPEVFAPTWHGGMESQMPWLNVHDDLPRRRCEESPVLIKAWESVGREDPAEWTETQVTMTGPAGGTKG